MNCEDCNLHDGDLKNNKLPKKPPKLMVLSISVSRTPLEGYQHEPTK